MPCSSATRSAWCCRGHDSTLPVTVADIAYHTAAVARGSARPLVIADMPFRQLSESPQQAFRNAVMLMAAGAQMVRSKAARKWRNNAFPDQPRYSPYAPTSLTPQSVHQLNWLSRPGQDDSAPRGRADAWPSKMPAPR